VVGHPFNCCVADIGGCRRDVSGIDIDGNGYHGIGRVLQDSTDSTWKEGEK